MHRAIHLMQRRGVECVLVRENEEVVGILTERDILMKAAGDKVDLNAIRVCDIMTPDPVMLRDADTARRRPPQDVRRRLPPHPARHPTAATPLVVSIQDLFRHISEFIPQRSP